MDGMPTRHPEWAQQSPAATGCYWRRRLGPTGGREWSRDRERAPQCIEQVMAVESLPRAENRSAAEGAMHDGWIWPSSPRVVNAMEMLPPEDGPPEHMTGQRAIAAESLKVAEARQPHVAAVLVEC
jgi:hypothetical protein